MSKIPILLKEPPEEGFQESQASRYSGSYTTADKSGTSARIFVLSALAKYLFGFEEADLSLFQNQSLFHCVVSLSDCR